MHVQEADKYISHRVCMRLTSYTDYALRTLMYLAEEEGRLVTINEVAEKHGIVKSHLSKIVNQLTQLGFIHAVRGRRGGLRLGRPAQDIRVSDVVRHTEPDFFIAECFNGATNRCSLTANCALRGLLGEATRAFLHVLSRASLADLASAGTDAIRFCPTAPMQPEMAEVRQWKCPAET